MSSLVEIQAHNLFAPANRGRWMVKSGLGKAAKQPRSAFPAFHAFGPVAQRLEQGTHNPLVRGSNPCGPTTLTPLQRFIVGLRIPD